MQVEEAGLLSLTYDICLQAAMGSPADNKRGICVVTHLCWVIKHDMAILLFIFQILEDGSKQVVVCRLTWNVAVGTRGLSSVHLHVGLAVPASRSWVELTLRTVLACPKEEAGNIE